LFKLEHLQLEDDLVSLGPGWSRGFRASSTTTRWRNLPESTLIRRGVYLFNFFDFRHLLSKQLSSLMENLSLISIEN
jgi:hypothetical protein